MLRITPGRITTNPAMVHLSRFSRNESIISAKREKGARESLTRIDLSPEIGKVPAYKGNDATAHRMLLFLFGSRV